MKTKSKISKDQGPSKSPTEIKGHYNILIPSMVESALQGPKYQESGSCSYHPANLHLTAKVSDSDSVVEDTLPNSEVEEQGTGTSIDIAKKDNCLSQSNATEQSVLIPVQEPIVMLEPVSSHDKVHNWLTNIHNSYGNAGNAKEHDSNECLIGVSFMIL